ncbi:hypothetical protein TrVE_jg13256 [Triparma verrucosa]|uniref:Uncharacterized protein n=1 Tax=Triparma verrucosa TaxID=1606542 RepID=A0A9W7ERK7_9STRA|nr:hypothetical protein TrVE_jg13256 [Triparma verrucosa]
MSTPTTYHYVLSSSILPCSPPSSSPITYTITAALPPTKAITAKDGSGFPQCPNTLNTHSNFVGSSHELLSILMHAHPPPSSDDVMCLVTMDQTASFTSTEIFSIHSQWASLPSPQRSILTLPVSTTFSSENLPLSSPLPSDPSSPPNQLLSSLHFSFLYSPCSLYHSVPLDPFYPYLSPPSVDAAYFIRSWSKGWDAYAVDFPGLNDARVDWKHTLRGRREEIKTESQMRYRTLLRIGGGNGEERRRRFGHYGVFESRGGLEAFKSWTGRGGEGWESEGSWKNSVEPASGGSEVEEAYKCTSECQYVDMFKKVSSSSNIVHANVNGAPKGHNHPTGSDAYRAFNPHINPLPLSAVSTRNPFVFVLFIVMLVMIFFGYVAHNSKSKMTAERRKGLTNPMSVMTAKIV